MITEEERQEIIDAAVEKALLLLPEVVGNLISNQIQQVKMNREFYEKFPEFGKNKEIVSSVLERVDGENPGVGYKEVLDKAVPLIRERLSVAKKLDLKVSPKPNRTLSLSDNGEL